MRVEYLEELVDLAETLNFTQTAKRFCISQPVLSKHISSLETELGAQLFLRDQGRTRITGVGKLIVADARETVLSYYRMRDNAKRYQKGLTDSMAVGFIVGAGFELVPTAHTRFSREYPFVDVQYHTYEYNDILSALSENTIDIAIGLIFEGVPKDRFETCMIYKESFCIAMASDHPFAKRSHLTPADLRGETMLIPSKTFASLDRELMAFLNPEANGILIDERVFDMNTLPLMLMVENCIGLAPRHLESYYKKMTDGKVRLVPIEHRPLSNMVAALWKQSNEKPFLAQYAHILRHVAESQNKVF